MKKKITAFTVLFLLAVPLVFPAFAEQTENETKVVARETASQRAAAAAARKAREKKSFETVEKATFAQVLAQPGNVELNFNYARRQVEEGNLLGAAGTLERLLIMNPGLHEVRLFYALVLFRLDNTVEAERELTTLEQLALPAAIASEVKAYRKAIELRKKKTRFSLSESVGFQYDTNRNASPSSKRVLFSEFPLNTSGSNRKEDDTSFLNITSIDVAHDLGFQAGHELIGSFTYFLQEQTEVDSLDLGSFQYELGGVYKHRWVNFTPTFFATHTFLSRENYLRTQGGNFRFNRRLTDRLDFEAAYRLERQDFLPIEENQAARERDGEEHSFTAGAAYTLSPSMRAGSGLLFGNKNARADYEDYRRFMLQNYHLWLLGKGQFLMNSLDATFDRYQVPDVAVAGRHRHDKMLRYRVTYGAPLTTLGIGKVLPEGLKDITLTCSFEYFRSLSNITNYTYKNFKFQTLLTKKWEF